MDGGGLGLLKFLAPQIPSLANTAVWHSLGMTENSKQWDLRTAITVQVLRQMMSGNGKPRSVLSVQGTTLKDPGVKGKMWVAKATVPAPGEGEEGLRERVFRAVEEMKPEGVKELVYTRPGLEDVEVEWTGFRPGAGKEEALPDMDEKEKYKRLLGESTRTSETTILYFHGGAYYLCDPSTHRLQCSRLAKECGGKVCSVRYRLAPQTAFPGQLLDALMVYLSLIYPPANSLHNPIPASNIVLTGDSAGGNLSFALLQLLLQFHRTSSNPTTLFHGIEVSIPLPAGATANSGWFDISRCMPSLESYAQYDYLPQPNHDISTAPFKDDTAWPADPPRGDLFCDLSLIDHPLVSMLAADDWSKSPPMWLSTGWEMLHDEDAFVASRAAGQGVRVQYEEFEAMPHCFQILIPGLATADKCYQSWGAFCRRCVEEPGSVAGSGRLIRAKSGKEEVLRVEGVSEMSLEEVRLRVGDAKARRVKAFEKRVDGLAKAAL